MRKAEVGLGAYRDRAYRKVAEFRASATMIQKVNP